MTKFGGCIRYGLVILVVTVMMAYPSYSWAAEWQVPELGVMEGQQGFTALDLGKWVDDMAEVAAKNKAGTGLSTPPPKLQVPDNIPFDIKCYQLQFLDKEGYHTAFAAVLKNKQYNPYLEAFFTSQEDSAKEQLDKFNQQIEAAIKEMKTKMAAMTTDGFDLKVLDFKPITRMTGTNEVVYAVSGRIIIDMKGVIMPLYAKAYFVHRDGKVISIIVGSSDAEAKFWSNCLDKLVRTLKK